MKLYIAVTSDKYELPIAVFDNISQLVKWANRPYGTIYENICRKREDKKNKCRYIKINIGDEKI